MTSSPLPPPPADHPPFAAGPPRDELGLGSDEASRLRAAEARVDALSTRIAALEKGDRSGARRVALAAALGVGTIVALGLPFLWDDSSRYKEPISVAGWRLLNYDALYAFNQPVNLFPRLVPWLIVLAAAFTALVSVAAVRPVLAIVAAVVDGALIIASLAGAHLSAMTGLKLDSADKQSIAGPGSGWWVAGLLLAAWAALAVDTWIGRTQRPEEPSERPEEQS